MFPVNYGPGQSQKTQNFNGVGIAPQLMRITVEDVAAGADISGRLLAHVPAGYQLTVLAGEIMSHGSPAGIDDANTCVVVLKNGTNAMVTKTFNTATEFPAAEAVVSLGAISETYKTIAANGYLSLYMTNGATANTPLFTIQLLVSLDQVLV